VTRALGFFQKHPEADAFVLEKWHENWSTSKIAEALTAQYGEPCNKNIVIGRKNRLKLKEGIVVAEYDKVRQRFDGKEGAAKQQMLGRPTAPKRQAPLPAIPEHKPEEILAVVPIGKGKRFTRVRDGECKRFLPGHHGMHGIVCAEPALAGKAWCAACFKQLYVPGTAFGAQKRNRNIIRVLTGSGQRSYRVQGEAA
jgi:hypothetical protein